MSLCVVAFGCCFGACVWFNSGVLVNDILLDVASWLWLKSLAVGGTLERTREGKGTSELRWQIKVDFVHTKKDSMLQTSLMVYSESLLSPPTRSFISLLSSLPHLCVGGGGVWPLSGGERDQQSGLLPQRCPGAAPSAAFQGQHGGDGRSEENCRGTQGHAWDFNSPSSTWQ